MARSITITETYTGKPLTLDIARIKTIDELASEPGIFGVARRPGSPDADFPVAWISYQSSEDETPVNYYALQSADEVRAAIAAGGGDLHRASPAMQRLFDYLGVLYTQGVASVPVYLPFGTAAAQNGTWRYGPVEDRPVIDLLTNLKAGRTLAAETLDDLRGRESRVKGQLESLDV